MTVPQSNPLVEYGLQRIKDLTRGIKATEREIDRYEERVLSSRVELESREVEREQVMDALVELGIDQDDVETLMDNTADEYDREYLDRSTRSVTK